MLRRSKSDGISKDRSHEAQFESITQRECHTKVGLWLQTLYGSSAVRTSEESATHFVAIGSALTMVSTIAAENHVAIQIASPLITKANLTQDLLAQLLMENLNELVFSSFALDENGDIWLTRTLMGNCSAEDFVTSIRAVAVLANEYDDVIRTHWGGERAIDRIDMM
jgi:hypothetical protein